MESNAHLPEHLSGREAKGAVFLERVAQFEVGSQRNLVYLLLDWDNRLAVMVDPQRELTHVQAVLDRNRLKLTHVLLTHTHSDHTAGLPRLAETHPDVPVLCHADDAHRLPPGWAQRGRLRTLRDGERLAVGRMEIKVLHTPGHSAGACCFLLAGEPNYLVTGDTLFVRDCGRCDLDTGDVEEMFESLQRLKTLSRPTVILPGHRYAPECASTIGRELEQNPALRCASAEELSRLP
jgi:glyoxylase-like metal-dependent hydrolase (beta-lactamase superfamily II)